MSLCLCVRVHSAFSALDQKIETRTNPPDPNVSKNQQRVFCPEQKKIVDRKREGWIFGITAQTIQKRNRNHAARDKEAKNESIPLHRKRKFAKTDEEHRDHVPGKRQEYSDAENVFVTIAEIKKSFGGFHANVGAKLKIHAFARQDGDFGSGPRRSSAPEAACGAEAVHERKGRESVKEHDRDCRGEAGQNPKGKLQE